MSFKEVTSAKVCLLEDETYPSVHTNHKGDNNTRVSIGDHSTTMSEQGICSASQLDTFFIQEDEREFDYGEGSPMGPRRWGELKKEWKDCKIGGMQSPIDMSNQRVEIIPKSAKLFRHYKPSNATIKNRGHDIMFESTAPITLSDRPIGTLLRSTPSMAEDPNLKNQIAVTGVLYKIGHPDSFLSKLATNISSMVDANNHQHTRYGVMDPRKIKTNGKMYYRYMGSLTVPPCTEGVIWTIDKKIRTVSKDQVMMLREVVHDVSTPENSLKADFSYAKLTCIRE
ncbi:hypothetical protein LguiB_015787 [Lonicera macranthoides]